MFIYCIMIQLREKMKTTKYSTCAVGISRKSFQKRRFTENIFKIYLAELFLDTML